MDDLELQYLMPSLLDKNNPIISHGKRVAKLACVIAEGMGYSDGKIKLIHHAAIVHDIGKIQLPVEIINKPSALDENELVLIKKHPELGYSLLQTMRLEPIISQVVLQHHERMNGSGYPFSLRANKIIPVARIVAVADVIESMVSSQLYRPALAIEEALQEIEQNSGLLYDSDIVAVAISIIEKKEFNFDT